MIQLTLKPEHLDLVVRCTSRFRDRTGQRPTLAAMHVRLQPGSDRERLEVTATDSYHLVRVTVPVLAVKDSRSRLGVQGGVLIDLPSADTARLVAKARVAERARLKAEQEAIRVNRMKRSSARARQVEVPAEIVPAAPTAVRLTISGNDATSSRFGLSGAGVWNDGGCFAVAVDGAADQIDRVVGGGRTVATYVDADTLIDKAKATPLAEAPDRVAYKSEYLGDVCAAAAAFSPNAPMHVETVARLTPTLLTVEGTAFAGLEGCSFLGLVMPVRVS